MFSVFGDPSSWLAYRRFAAWTWPPPFPVAGGLLGPDIADPAHNRLAEIPRARWRRDDWKAYALFLEERGKSLLADLLRVKQEAEALRSQVKPVRKRGRPRTKPRPTFSAKHLSGLLGGPTKRPVGRPRNPDREKLLRDILELVEETKADMRAANPKGRVTDKAAIERIIERHAKAHAKSATRLKQAHVARLQKWLAEARERVPKKPK